MAVYVYVICIHFEPLCKGVCNYTPSAVLLDDLVEIESLIFLANKKTSV